MANPKHLALLKRGVEVWNKWVEKVWIRGGFANIEDRPDLSEADLGGSNLSGIILAWANLRGVNLYGANLTWANLDRADLIGADLREANFSNANLGEAFLSKANLGGADLSKVDLAYSNFNGTQMNSMKIYGAQMVETNIINVDLRGVEGLESVKHLGPSYIDISTLITSEGDIPRVFLRGAGWPDEVIENVIPFFRKSIQFYSAFISYSHNDEDFVKRLYNDLQGEGVRVWYAPEDLKIGEEFDKVINREIRMRDKLILVLSENSVKSDWVAFEVEQAEEEEKKRHPNLPEDEPLEKPVLFPIQIDDAVDECNESWARKIKRRRHIGDFRKWETASEYKKAFERLLRDLKGSG